MITKICTDIEQSKILAEILPFESADMHYVRKTHDFMGNPVDGEWSHPKYGNPNSKHANYIIQNFESYEKIPCWSLAALLDVMPHIQEFYPTIEKINDKFVCRYKGSGVWTNGTDPVDTCYEMLVLLHKENLI